MHRSVQPKSLSWWGKMDNSLILQQPVLDMHVPQLKDGVLERPRLPCYVWAAAYIQLSSLTWTVLVHLSPKVDESIVMQSSFLFIFGELSVYISYWMIIYHWPMLASCIYMCGFQWDPPPPIPFKKFGMRGMEKSSDTKGSSVQTLLAKIKEEARARHLAGANWLSDLWPGDRLG